MLLPTRMKVRSARALPRLTKSSTLIDDPSRDIPNVLIAEPKRTKDRSERLLPRWKKSRMLIELPKRVMP
jgi:hypothetical protein